MIRPLASTALAALLAAPVALAQSAEPVEQGAPNVPDFTPAFPEQNRAPGVDSGAELDVETVAEGLEHPWGMDELPDGAMLVTERPGRLRVVDADGNLRDEPVSGLPEVFAVDQGGLLDVAVGPDFVDDGMIYWTYSKPMGDDLSATAAARGVLSEDLAEVTEVEDIFVQEPPSASPMHYGSRIVFDGDGHAFITTGEHSIEAERVFAQDLDKTYGKVIRVALDGSTPEDNPFVDESGAIGTIWSYGHRNIQGAAIHPDSGELWILEHGPKGGDELNLVEAGANYGWPVVSYGINYNDSPVSEGRNRHEPDFVEPRYYWDPVTAPGGITFYDGDMFDDWNGDLLSSGLVVQSIVRLEMDGDTVTGEEWLLREEHGRIRDVAVAADGAILALTDASNGALLRVTPAD